MKLRNLKCLFGGHDWHKVFTNGSGVKDSVAPHPYNSEVIVEVDVHEYACLHCGITEERDFYYLRRKSDV